MRDNGAWAQRHLGIDIGAPRNNPRRRRTYTHQEAAELVLRIAQDSAFPSGGHVDKVVVTAEDDYTPSINVVISGISDPRSRAENTARRDWWDRVKDTANKELMWTYSIHQGRSASYEPEPEERVVAVAR